jgi:hypothetical protein
MRFGEEPAGGHPTQAVEREENGTRQILGAEGKLNPG